MYVHVSLVFADQFVHSQEHVVTIHAKTEDFVSANQHIYFHKVTLVHALQIITVLIVLYQVTHVVHQIQILFFALFGHLMASVIININSILYPYPYFVRFHANHVIKIQYVKIHNQIVFFGQVQIPAPLSTI